MSRLRSQRQQLRAWLDTPDWRGHLADIAQGGMTSVGPLMAMLPAGPVERLRAAMALGETARVVFAQHADQGRDIVRRLMWRMSEESGNIGWGVPEAYCEVMSRVPSLAKEFHSMLLTTLIDLGFDDNYCDLDLLRRSCYFAVARFACACPDYAAKSRLLLATGLQDEDPICRGMAIWGLGQLAPTLNEAPLLRMAAESCGNASVVLTDGDTEAEYPIAELAKLAIMGKVPMPWKDERLA